MWSGFGLKFARSVSMHSPFKLSVPIEYKVAEVCTEQFHLLRDYMLEQTEARGIVGAID